MDIAVRLPRTRLDRQRVEERRRLAERWLPLNPSYLVGTFSAPLAVAYWVIAGGWVEAFWPAVIVFSLIAAGPLVFRALAQPYPQRRIFESIASFWLVPCVVFAHSQLSPIVDAV